MINRNHYSSINHRLRLPARGRWRAATYHVRRGLMVKVMEGFRVLEVAQFTFVPAAGAILADWGADVIKVEHPVGGDTQRGFLNMGGIQVDPDRHPLMEHPNRGKRSVGIDVSHAGRAGGALRTGQDHRRVPDQLHAQGAAEEQIRRGAHPRGEPEHRLCPRYGLRRQGGGTRRRWLRRNSILDSQRHWLRVDAGRAGRRTATRHSRLWRLHRRHEHRWWHLGRTAASRADRRSPRG